MAAVKQAYYGCCGLSNPVLGEITWRGASIRDLKGEYFSELTYIGHLSGTKR